VGKAAVYPEPHTMQGSPPQTAELAAYLPGSLLSPVCKWNGLWRTPRLLSGPCARVKFVQSPLTIWSMSFDVLLSFVSFKTDYIPCQSVQLSKPDQMLIKCKLVQIRIYNS